MSRLTLCIALIAAGLAVVGCGGSSSDKSSSDQPSSQSKPIVTPSTGATAQASAAKPKASTEKKEAAKTASGLPAGSAKAKAVVRKQLAEIKHQRKQSKSLLNAIKPPKLSKQTLTLVQKAQRGQLTRKEAAKLAKQVAAAQKQVTSQTKGLSLPKPQEAGKKGRSLIPGRVAAACQQHLRAVDGVLSSSAKASKLPGALNATIGELKVLGSTSSPAATGVTGDIAGMSRTQETMTAMQRVVAPAKAYKANPSAANRKKLTQALKGLRNTAKVDALDRCAIA